MEYVSNKSTGSFHVTVRVYEEILQKYCTFICYMPPYSLSVTVHKLQFPDCEYPNVSYLTASV